MASVFASVCQRRGRNGRLSLLPTCAALGEDEQTVRVSRNAVFSHCILSYSSQSVPSAAVRAVC